MVGRWRGSALCVSLVPAHACSISPSHTYVRNHGTLVHGEIQRHALTHYACDTGLLIGLLWIIGVRSCRKQCQAKITCTGCSNADLLKWRFKGDSCYYYILDIVQVNYLYSKYDFLFPTTYDTWTTMRVDLIIHFHELKKIWLYKNCAVEFFCEIESYT